MVWQLLKKEFHLQRSSIAFALAMIVVWGVLLTLAPGGATVLIPKQLTMGQLVSLMQAFFIGPCLLGIVPLFIGAAMVAEERKLGVWDWHLSLPAARWLQWLIKLAVGFLLTLLLALLVAPLMDGLLTRVLAGRGDPFPLLTDYLRLNPAYRFLPLLLMAAGAFVSSIAADPYKAFFGGLVCFGLVLVSTRLTDPAWLLLMPWGNPTAASQVRFHPFLGLIPGLSGVLLGLIPVLSAILGAVALFNFRFEAFRWRRFALELLALVLLINGTVLLAMHLAFGVGSLVSQKAQDVEPLILSARQQRGLDPPQVNWVGIEPLLVKRTQPSLLVNPIRSAQFYGRTMFGSIYQLPGQNKLVAELNSFPFWPGRQSSQIPGWNQIVELNLAGGAPRTILQVPGWIKSVASQGGAFGIASSVRGTYWVTPRWPVPLKAGGLLSDLLLFDAQFGAPSSHQQVTSIQLYKDANRKSIKVGQETIPCNFMQHLYPYTGLAKVYLNRDTKYETWLVRQQGDAWTVLNKQPGYGNYAVTSDGRWFAHAARTGLGYPAKELTLFSVDRATSWTLAAPEGQLILGGQFEKVMLNNNIQYLLNNNNSQQALTLSPSSRFLPFVRTKTVKLNQDGQSIDTQYPSSVEVALLDLKTGKECHLLQREPERAVQETFQREMKDWLWQRWTRAEKLTWSENLPNLNPVHMVPTPPCPHYVLSLPPMAWAPKRDKLALLYDDRIYIYDYLPESADKWRAQVKSLDALGGFMPGPMLGLIGFQIDHLEFLDADTLLTWGNLGLFKLDLKTVVQAMVKAPSPPKP